jgi:hypothetical protein
MAPNEKSLRRKLFKYTEGHCPTTTPRYCHEQSSYSRGWGMLCPGFGNRVIWRGNVHGWASPLSTLKLSSHRLKLRHNMIKICSGEVSININHKWCKGPIIVRQEEQKSDQKQNSKSKQRIEKSNCRGCCESAPTTTTQTMTLKQHYTETRTIVKIYPHCGLNQTV